MKSLFIILSIAFLEVTTSLNIINNSSGDTITNVLTFDGYEGGYFFFTDSNQSALTLERSDDSSLNSELLISNDVTGKKFKVIYTSSDTSDSPTSLGLILHVDQL